MDYWLAYKSEDDWTNPMPNYYIVFWAIFVMRDSKDINNITNDSEPQCPNNSFDSNYYASRRIPVILQRRESGRVFGEVRDNLIVITGEDRKEHEYLIPKSKVSHFDDKQVFINISNNSLQDFEM